MEQTGYQLSVPSPSFPLFHGGNKGSNPLGDANRDRTERVALRRLGTVEDCAKVVEFLVTDLSDYVSGVVIPVDGGLLR